MSNIIDKILKVDEDCFIIYFTSNIAPVTASAAYIISLLEIAPVPYAA